MATTSTTTTSSSSTPGDAAHGKTIFSQNCASCHGATGREGGVGPSLTNEKSRKNYDQTVAWIKNPQPPMPKLFPSPLAEKDVDDVAAYVQTL
jgi:mono/diheme cytochrome c family protein